MTSDYKLSEYELLRLQRIKRNAERMKELGLDQNLWKKPKPKKKKVVSKVKRVPKGQERRSGRFSSRKKDGDLLILDYRAKDGEERAAKQIDYFNDDYEYDSDDDNKSNVTTVRHYTKRRSLKIDTEKWKLSETDCKSLAKADDNFMAKFEEFLEYENRISHPNKRNVMRQARKLAQGEGIRYESARYGWPEGCYFKKGVKITPMSDIVELMIEGQACEDKWGRDHGNGWLIKHPLKKLLLFQQFILNNPDFLTSKLRLTDYCNNEEQLDESSNTLDSDDECPDEVEDDVESTIFPIGTYIYKVFEDNGEDVEFKGKVISYDADCQLYKIRYEDSDEEEMDHNEVKYHRNPRRN